VDRTEVASEGDKSLKLLWFRSRAVTRSQSGREKSPPAATFGTQWGSGRVGRRAAAGGSRIDRSAL